MSNSTDALSPELPAASGLDDAAAQEGMTTQTKIIGASIVGGILLLILLSGAYAIIQAISHHDTPQGEKVRRACGCLPLVHKTLPTPDAELAKKQQQMVQKPIDWQTQANHRMTRGHQATLAYQQHQAAGEQRYRQTLAPPPTDMEDVPLVTPVAGYPTPQDAPRQRQARSMLGIPETDLRPTSPSMYSQSTWNSPPRDTTGLPVASPGSARSPRPGGWI